MNQVSKRVKAGERRAEQILRHGIECNDRLLLTELWNALRDAETSQRPGRIRDRLNRIRIEVGAAIAEIESEIMRAGGSTAPENACVDGRAIARGAGR